MDPISHTARPEEGDPRILKPICHSQGKLHITYNMKKALSTSLIIKDRDSYHLHHCNGFEFRDYFCKQHIVLNHVFQVLHQPRL